MKEVSDVNQRSDDLSEMGTDSDDIHYSDPASASRVGWAVLLIGFGGFMLWAALAPLDRGVAVPGTVVVSGNHKQVKPLYAGIVRAINVKEGDKVEAGQLLIELDTTQTQAQLKIATVQLVQKQIEQARLLAERDGQAELEFESDLSASEHYAPVIKDVLALQRRLLKTRRQTLHNEIAVMRENAEGLKAQVQALEEARRAKLEQVKLLQEELKGLRELAKDGFLPRNRLSERERELSQLFESLSQDMSNLAHIRSAISEVNLNILKQEKEYQREIEAQLAEIHRDVDNLQNQVTSLGFDVANASIQAPSEGVVSELKAHTVGGVVQAGELLMEIVPSSDPLKVSAQIASNLIDKVQVGLPVNIRFSALNYQTTPIIPGQLIKISPDALFDENTHASYYKGLVEVTPEGMEKLKKHEIKAGMPADVFIRTGERTLLHYLFRPIMVRFEAALQED